MVENFLREAKAHYDGAVRAEIGFAERLVWFWSNHFCINSDVTVQAGAYEREAIRPHVLGKFLDLLIAAESHPAMLQYLGNAASMGPNSVAGINRDRGLNENLGREILELHTLGVRTGYTQDDVLSFAKVITGWTTYVPDLPEHGGEFLFYSRFHEPGPQTVLGKAYRVNHEGERDADGRRVDDPLRQVMSRGRTCSAGIASSWQENTHLNSQRRTLRFSRHRRE
jgi:uncharacterized protein (DUF1800 family)